MKKQVVAITTIALLSSSIATSTFASTYKVQKGDTLTHIAKKYSTNVSNLKNWNSLRSDMIYVNQTLRVTNEIIETSKSSAPKSEPIKTDSFYTVDKGDSLSKIAKKHQISLQNLMKWNNLDHHIIYPGQKLMVATKTTEKKTKNIEVNSKETKPPASTDYTVQKGDTLSKISMQSGINLKQLKDWNNLTSDIIYIGQKLKVSSKDKTLDVGIETLLGKAKELLGVPYLWGGFTTEGLDCSGFIYHAFKSTGTNVSRLSTEGYYSRSYYVDTPQIGDLVFFENTYKKGISHMGIYLGNNEFIHASTSKGVIISNLNQTYYKERFDGFKRFY